MDEGPSTSGATRASAETRSGFFAGVPPYMKTAFRWAVGLAALALGASLFS